MPELPEVETIARGLRLGAPAQSSVLGRAIDQVNVLWDRSIAVPSAAEFTERAHGQRITEIGRRGKFLRLALNRDILLVHLRMSGDFYPQEIQNELSPYARVVFRLDDGRWLVFQDPRKFGRMWLTDDANAVLGKLGPEPFSLELTPEIFYNRLISYHRQLKPLLLDQHFLAGMGNIYTDEALHLAQLHPRLRSDTLTKMQAERLLGAIRSTLSAGIQRNGTSIDWVYRGGDYQRYLTVYKQTGSPCKNCGTPIERFMVGQRSTHYCPNCQKKPDPPSN